VLELELAEPVDTCKVIAGGLDEVDEQVVVVKVLLELRELGSTVEEVVVVEGSGRGTAACCGSAGAS
jgi:hypothetical protein